MQGFSRFGDNDPRPLSDPMPFAFQMPVETDRIRIRVCLLLLLISGSFALVGCRTGCKQWCDNGFKVGPNYRKPCAAVAEDWIDADDKRLLDEPVDHVAWWAESFQDPILNQLVAEAYRRT
jgi:hypothetical protein